MSGDQALDVAAVVEYWRHRLSHVPPALILPSLIERVDELTDAARSTVTHREQLRPAGEALVLAAHVAVGHAADRTPGRRSLYPPVLLLVQLWAGLRLIDEAFTAATVDLQDTT